MFSVRGLLVAAVMYVLVGLAPSAHASSITVQFNSTMDLSGIKGGAANTPVELVMTYNTGASPVLLTPEFADYQATGSLKIGNEKLITFTGGAVEFKQFQVQGQSLDYFFLSVCRGCGGVPVGTGIDEQGGNAPTILNQIFFGFEVRFGDVDAAMLNSLAALPFVNVAMAEDRGMTLFLSLDPSTPNLFTATQTDFPANGFTLTFSEVNPVPIPAALPLFATVLAGGGLIAWRRKRKAAKLSTH